MSRRRYNRAPYRPMLETDWAFVEKHCPGARDAWARDVGLPDADYTIGVSGGHPTYPRRAVAMRRDWTSVPVPERKRFEYLLSEKTWRQTLP